MDKEITIWYDKKADLLEVTFERKPGYFVDTDNNAVQERVDMNGNVIGFMIMGVSSLSTAKSISVRLKNLIPA